MSREPACLNSKSSKVGNRRGEVIHRYTFCLPSICSVIGPPMTEYRIKGDRIVPVTGWASILGVAIVWAAKIYWALLLIYLACLLRWPKETLSLTVIGLAMKLIAA